MRFLLVPLVVILLAMIPKSAEAQSDRFMTDDTLPWIHFSWSSGNLGGRLIEKTAMIVPLKIEELPYAFEAQFDLGACSTMIYGKAFAPYLAMASDIREKIDTTQTVFLQGASYPCFADLSIQLDGVEFPNRRVVFFEDFGTEMTKDSLCTSTIKHIGTIAADLFEGKILIIDYKNQILCGIESLPSDWEQRVEFVDIEYVKESNLVFLPLQIGDITYRVMFDTGSSIFPLLSSLSKIARISNPDRCVDSLTVLSWGKPVDVYGYIPDVKIMLGKEELDNSLPVYGSDMLNDKNLDRSGYWGLTGNRYFLDKTIVIDYKNRRFGILKE